MSTESRPADPTRSLGSYRSQPDRREATIRKLLDATVESILEVGYAATTVRSVTERAGVSLGARSHFFPRRIDMIVAALEQLCADRLAAARAEVDRIPTAETARLQALLDIMWHDYTSPSFVAGMKLWVAAADDPELHAHLVTTTRVLNAALQQLYAHAIGEELGRVTDIGYRMGMAHDLVMGRAFGRAFEPREEPIRPQSWPQLRKNLERLILG